jgi:hypothetical protein
MSPKIAGLLRNIDEGICLWPGNCNQTVMRSLRHILDIAAVTCALTVPAKADLLFMGAVNFHNGPNDPTTNAQAATRFLRNNFPGPFPSN